MMTGALIIYLFADIRELSRKEQISIPLADLEAPMSSQQILEVIKNNVEDLRKHAIDPEDLAKRLSMLKSIQSNEGSMFNLLFGGSKKSVTVMPRVTHFCDTNGTFPNDTSWERNKRPWSSAQCVDVPCQTHTLLSLCCVLCCILLYHVMNILYIYSAEKEVVHAIVVNEARKRVTVVFRGSVTQQDFIQDAKCAQRKVDNPVFPLVNDADLMPEQLRIHTGFYEYLHKINEETGQTRLEEIFEQIKNVFSGLEEGYELYVTGHSLGGALCTLFGFYAAADETMSTLTKGPIIVYSVASPYVGNWKFRSAFQELERRKRIQHLRIANLEDMVTNMPFAAPKLAALSPLLSAFQGAGNLYKHVGIRLQFNEEEGAQPYSLFYPKDQSDDDEYTKEIGEAIKSGKSLLKSFFHIMTNDVDTIVKHHSCEEYENRLQNCKDALDDRTLDDLYADKDITGVMMEAEYKPQQIKLNGYQRAARAWGAMRTNSTVSKDSTNANKKEGEVVEDAKEAKEAS